MVKEKKIRTVNDHGRGFKRTGKQWENSLCDHVGKIIDNSNFDQIRDFLLYSGVALLGAFSTNDLRGLLIGPIGLKLASSENIVAGGAGVAILTTLGLLTISKISPTATMPMWAFWPTITGFP